MSARSLAPIVVAASVILITACTLEKMIQNGKEAAGGFLSNPQITGVMTNVFQQEIRNGELFTQTDFGRTIGPLISQSLIVLLSQYEQKQLQTATARTVATGENSTWENPENKKKIETKVVKTEKKTEKIKVRVLKDRIDEVPPLDIIGETYRATKISNVRGGPSDKIYKVLDQLQKGQTVNVVGQVKTEPWFLISADDGVGSGFVFSKLLEPEPSEEPIKAETLSSTVEEQEVISERVCRTVEQSVSLPDGSVKSETIEACQGPNGWETQV